MERNNTLDFLKGIAIIFVIITHFSWSDASRLNFGFPFWIDMAVPIFMVVSGYTWSLSNEKKKIVSLHECYNIRTLIKKFIRFTVPFAFLFVIDYAYMFVLHIIKDVSFSFFDFLNVIINGGPGPGAYYYPILLQMIIFFPFVYFIIKKYDTKGLLISFGINLLFEISKNAYGITSETYRLLIFRYLFLIAFGAWLCLHKNEDLKYSKILWGGVFCIGILFIVLTQYYDYTPVVFNEWTGTCLLAVLYICPIMVLLMKSKIDFKPINFFGKASYNIFIVQIGYYNLVSFLVYRYVEKPIYQMIIGLVVCIVGGAIFYLIEQKITNLILSKLL